MHGAGTYKFMSGHVYTGQWYQNQMQGPGKMEYGDGTSYKGDWHMSKMHGEGIFIDENKQVWDGIFTHGKFDSTV